jgi:hypothetical protein
VVDSQLNGTGHRLQIDGAARISFGLQLRPKFVAPFEYEAPRQIDLDNLAGVGDPPIREDQSS